MCICDQVKRALPKAAARFAAIFAEQVAQCHSMVSAPACQACTGWTGPAQPSEARRSTRNTGEVLSTTGETVALFQKFAKVTIKLFFSGFLDIVLFFSPFPSSFPKSNESIFSKF